MRTPAGGLPTSDTVRMSPSGSVSLWSTGTSVERPMRAPKIVSSFAIGSLFSSVGSGAMLSSRSSADSSSSSSDCSSDIGGIRSAQLSTMISSSVISHEMPVLWSLSTTTPRCSRNVSLLDRLWSTCSSRLCPASAHSRSTRLSLGHAEYTQPFACTGATAWLPAPWATTDASPPRSGCVISCEPVASTTFAAGSLACCSTASFGTSCAEPGSSSRPASASSATGVVPTAVSCSWSASPSSSRCSSCVLAKPSSVDSHEYSMAFSAETACTPPSASAVAAPPGPSTASGSSSSASNEVAFVAGSAHSRPSTASMIVTVPPRSVTCTSPGSSA